MSASFTTLFERGRYSSQGRWHGLNDLERKHRMEQQERFAVGMIGFAVKHDVHFKAHFLDKVCGLMNLSNAEDWEVSVEPENWGDLILKHRPSGTFVVAEFKITAELAEHQNPASPLFDEPAANGQCAGYGWEIARVAKRDGWMQLRYVTLEKKASWPKCRSENRGLMCLAAEWRQFLRTDVSQESSLEADLYDCLSRFGLSIFTSRRMRQMKLANHATEPLPLLAGVLAKFGVDFKAKLLDVGSSAEALGVNIVAKDFPNIARVVEPDEDSAGWFGYESDPPGPRLSVWFYCYSSTGIKVGAQQRIQAALRKAGFQNEEFGDDGWSVWVRCMAGDSTGDAEWFTKVLSALNTE